MHKCLSLMPRITRRFKEKKVTNAVLADSRPPTGGPFFGQQPKSRGQGQGGCSVSDAEVCATFLVRATPLLPLLWGVLGSAAGGLGLQPRLLPFPLADFVFSIPFVQGPLSPPFWGAHSPPVGGFRAPFWGVPSPALRGAPLIQKSFQRPAAAAG